MPIETSYPVILPRTSRVTKLIIRQLGKKLIIRQSILQQLHILVAFMKQLSKQRNSAELLFQTQLMKPSVIWKRDGDECRSWLFERMDSKFGFSQKTEQWEIRFQSWRCGFSIINWYTMGRMAIWTHYQNDYWVRWLSACCKCASRKKEVNRFSRQVGHTRLIKEGRPVKEKIWTWRKTCL